MGILPNEFLGAQDLLLKLVQILTPFIESPDIKDPKGIASFSKRLFIPPRLSENEARLPSRVRLLTTLQDAKREMNRWIEALPLDPPQAQESRKKEEIAQKERSAEKREPEKPAIHSSVRQRPEPFPIKKGEIQGQAKELVIQVRRAIQTLSTSLNIEEPKMSQFRDAMRRLKPMIDELIEAVGKSEMQGSSDNSQTSHEKTRRATPISARAQQLFKSEIPLPFREKRELPAGKEGRQPREARLEQKQERREARPFSRIPVERGGERVPEKKSPPEIRAPEKFHPPLKSPERLEPQRPLPPALRQEPELQIRPKPRLHEEVPARERRMEEKPIPPTSKPPQPAMKEIPQAALRPSLEEPKKEMSAPVESRPTPLAAPFTPQIVPSAAAKKGKKKPRSFWLKDEEEEEEEKRD